MDNKEKQDYIYFWKLYETNGFLGNWYRSDFYDSKDNSYTCNEQYMMAEKARLFKDNETLIDIMNTIDPKFMRTLGRKITPFDQKKWDKKKEQIMIDGLMLKFSQNESLKKKLLDTKNSILVEASPYDKIWGAGLTASNIIKNNNKWPGENLLGKCLMIIRDKLQ